MQTMQLVNDYLADCQANGASPGTISNKQSLLGRFALDNPDLPLLPEPIFQFLATLGKSQATRTQGRKNIRAFYTFVCQKHGQIIDPMPQVAVPLRAAKKSRGRVLHQSSAPLMHMGGGRSTEVLTPTRQSPAPTAELLSTSEVIANFIASKKGRWKEVSFEWYNATFTPFIAQFKYLPLDPDAIWGFIAAHDTKHKRWTRFRTLRTLYIFLHKRMDLPNPFDKIDPPSPDEAPVIPLDDQEIGRLLSAVASDQEQGIIHTLLTTGMRPGELRNLKPESIMEDTIVLDGKTGIDRMPVKPDVRDLLLRISGPNYVFDDESGRPFSKKGLYDVLKNIMLRANVREGKGGARVFRHTFITRVYDESGDPFLVQRLARHASLTMTKHYEHAGLKSTIKKYQDLDFLPPDPGRSPGGEEEADGGSRAPLLDALAPCEPTTARGQPPQGEDQGVDQDPNVIQFSEKPTPPYIIKEYAYRLPRADGSQKCWRIVGANGIWWPTTGDHENFFSFEEAQEKLRELSDGKGKRKK